MPEQFDHEVADPTETSFPVTVDITPSPRILKLIAEIEFRGWQCLAELVDNSFDELLDIKRSGILWTDPTEVSVVLPNARTPLDQAQIIVQDSGRGMTLEKIQSAVSAGYTSKDPVANLGLFGMGFNVATARLGRITRFLSTRDGDADWTGVEIDLDSMQDSFQVPTVREPKSSPSEHGTRIVVSNLRRIAEPLTKPPNQTALRKQFGSIYSSLLASEGIKLKINGIQVQPWQHCVWSGERSVVRSGERIPAVIPIDENLGDRAVCRACGTWQHAANDECEQCDSHDLEIRERHVRGWVGISRELERKEFGIDFLRNGRKILRFDKDIFRWDDPDDPSGSGEIEYPIEIPANAGRIVGEIHLDHVRVTYTKNSFDQTDPAWWAAIRILRGEGPLLPQKARALGYGRNDSPLARLHRGYRRNVPGYDYLMPGLGTDRRARRDTSEWVKRFHDGDPDYQTDEKWWDAVVEHEEALAAKRQTGNQPSENDDPTTEFLPGVSDLPLDSGITGEADTESGSDADGDNDENAGLTPVGPPLTDSEKAEALLQNAISLPELNGEFSAAGVATRPMRLRAWATRNVPLLIDGQRVPVWITSGDGGGFRGFVDIDHPHFQHFDDEPEDVLLMEIAQSLIMRAPRGSATPISAVFAELKDRHLQAHAIDPGRLIPEAGSLTHEVRERMVSCVTDNPERLWQALAEPERHITRERITEDLRTADVQPIIYSGDYLKYVPSAAVPRLVEEWPEAFFDNHLFARPYEGTTSGAQRQTIAMVTGYLSDIAWLANNPVDPPRDRMIRARLSLKLLPDEMA